VIVQTQDQGGEHRSNGVLVLGGDLVGGHAEPGDLGE
jgi:hypothetical protein